MVSLYITINFTCVPQGMYLLMRNVQWCLPISQLILHVSNKVCIFNEECAMVSPYITVDFTCVPQGMYF
jgi:hypothetical protein